MTEPVNLPTPFWETTPVAEAGIARRAQWSMRRRLRLLFARLRHPRARFASGCDVRAGFHLLILGQGSVQVGSRVVLDRDCTIECRGRLTIGPRTVFGHHVTIGIRDAVEIGSDCLVAEMVSIRDHDHGFHDVRMPMREQSPLVAGVVIEDNVWIGSKATITRGVRIGQGAIVGANSVVTHDVMPGTIVGGIPARIIRQQRSV
jgi:acetyltransferase-like isoleucine patch superfamily enzyme